jgi:diaminohydroxyphosphoribosylaminopyrimidine deaminase/5-amino-6-(5-phosphoribosylamino)uracil reductase
VVDDRLMRRAFELALRWPHTHPNPRVGSVVVDSSGEVIGEGWHRGPGTAHAEADALSRAGESASGATVYVSLEPCSHHGRTPPCADALISAGVTRVVAATVDPDPNVSGRGIQKLRDAGIEVEVGILEDEARQIDPAYFHHRETAMPLVTVKWAMTLDGSVAAADGTSQWITGEKARADAHRLRSTVDAVVVGAGTVREDDPLLDVRLDEFTGPQPRPVVIAGRTPLPDHARIWDRDPIVVSAARRDIPHGQLLEVAGEEYLPDPVATCRALAELGLLHLLLEGGPSVARAWWDAGVVNDGVVYVGARVGGGTGHSPFAGSFPTITAATDVEFGGMRSVGEDVAISFAKKN